MSMATGTMVASRMRPIHIRSVVIPISSILAVVFLGSSVRSLRLLGTLGLTSSLTPTQAISVVQVVGALAVVEVVLDAAGVAVRTVAIGATVVTVATEEHQPRLSRAQ